MADLSAYHPAVLASDTVDMQAGTLDRIDQAVSRGIPAAAISGALSVYNSVLGIGNFLGATSESELDIAESIRKYDNQMGDYYEDNKNALDIAGFIGSSVVTGGLGIGGLKLLRAGEGIGPLGRAMHMVDTKRADYLKAALAETAANGGNIPSLLSASRRAKLGWDVADQAATGLAAELAIAATSYDSPVFNGDTLGDFGWNIALGTALSGGIGGGLTMLTTRGILKDAQKAVEGQLRLADVVSDPSRLGLSTGSEALLFKESIEKLADDLSIVKFGYKMDGKAQSFDLDISKSAEAARVRAAKSAEDNLKIKFNTLAEGNANVGQAYYDFIAEGVAAAKAAGKDSDEVIGLLHGWLANVKAVGRLDPEAIALDARGFYANLHPVGATPEEKVKDIFSLKRTTTATQKYRLADDIDQASVSVRSLDDMGEDSIKAAFRANPEVDIVQLADGSVRVNPKSTRILKVNEPRNQYKQFVDLETGSLSSETVPRFGDIITPKGVQYGDDFVTAAGRVFKQVAYVPYASVADPLAAGARFAWASGLEPAALVRIIGNKVNTDDLPVLARLVELEPKLGAEVLTKLKFIDNGVERTIDDYVSLQSLLDTKRHELLEDALNKWDGAKQGSVPDARVFAAKLNVTRDWVEESISRGFRAARPEEHAVGRALSTAEVTAPKSVQVTWEFDTSFLKNNRMAPEDAYNMNMGPMHQVSRHLSAHYQLETRRMVNETVADAVLEGDAAFILSAERGLSRDATSDGAGATLFGASNAGYGERAKLFVQDLGKNVALITQRWKDKTIGALSGEVNAIRDNPRAAAELGVLTTALRKSPYRFVFDPGQPGRIVSTEVMTASARMKTSIDDAIARLEAAEPAHRHSFNVMETAVEDFLRSTTTINNKRQAKFTSLANAMGQVSDSHQGLIYVPPINTVKYPYHAFVRTKEMIGVPSDVSMITAKSEEQLRDLTSKLGNDYDVFFKGDTDKYFKAKGEYDYQMTLNESRVNSDLARRGILADFLPETRAENVLGDWLEWHAKQEEKLVRTAVQVKNRQFFSEMQSLSEQHRVVSESVTRGIGTRFKSKVSDPFGDYIKTALNISKQQEFPLLDSLNDFIDKLGLKAGDAIEKARRDAQAGLIDYTEANKIMKSYGIGGQYDSVAQYLVANERMPMNVVREVAQKANMILATTMLRLDFANSLINIISTPIMLGTEMQSIKGLIKGDSALAGKLAELRSIQVPGQPFRAPSTVKLIADSINDFFGPNKNQLITRYRDIGSVKDVSKLYHEMLDDLSWRPGDAVPVWKQRVEGAVEKGAKITGNVFSEDFTRFISANVMRKLTDPLIDAGKLSVKEQNAYISTFVNRVQGNYTTSQRPIVFQGTTGAAVSLFQTYAFNVLQQLGRHIQAGDKKTLMMFGGLQGTLFGLNGLPFFDAANQHILGEWVANNREHKDAYSVLPSLNKELGDWMLYGTASAMPLFTGSLPALYTRGDINPRHLTILPTSIGEVPAVQASIKAVSAVYNFGKNVKSGVDLSDAMLQGMEHQGLNRPLAGLAQVLGGRSTTANGTLISASAELQTTSWLGAMKERVVDYNGYSRLMGARPMDEAVGLSQYYRNKAYEAVDRARIERLGTVVKSKLYGNEAPSSEEVEDFMLRYARAGGDVQNFGRSLQRWSRDADVSIINQTMAKTNTTYGRRLKEIMGAQPIDDYQNGAPSPDEF
jgi:hypothetical protein